MDALAAQGMRFDRAATACSTTPMESADPLAHHATAFCAATSFHPVRGTSANARPGTAVP
jgi:hypothetical protein